MECHLPALSLSLHLSASSLWCLGVGRRGLTLKACASTRTPGAESHLSQQALSWDAGLGSCTSGWAREVYYLQSAGWIVAFVVCDSSMFAVFPRCSVGDGHGHIGPRVQCDLSTRTWQSLACHLTTESCLLALSKQPVDGCSQVSGLRGRCAGRSWSCPPAPAAQGAITRTDPLQSTAEPVSQQGARVWCEQGSRYSQPHPPLCPVGLEHVC